MVLNIFYLGVFLASIAYTIDFILKVKNKVACEKAFKKINKRKTYIIKATEKQKEALEAIKIGDEYEEGFSNEVLEVVYPRLGRKNSNWNDDDEE